MIIFSAIYNQVEPFYFKLKIMIQISCVYNKLKLSFNCLLKNLIQINWSLLKTSSCSHHEINWILHIDIKKFIYFIPSKIIHIFYWNFNNFCTYINSVISKKINLIFLNWHFILSCIRQSLSCLQIIGFIKICSLV